MQASEWGIILGAVAVPLVTLIGYLLTRRGARESREIEERRIEIDGLKTAVESMETALQSVERRAVKTEERVSELEYRLESSEDYIAVLLDHINTHKPPPPPERPRRRMPHTTPEGHA